VFLTQDGIGLADALYVRIEQTLAPATDRLAPAERRRLQTLLRQLVGPER